MRGVDGAEDTTVFDGMGGEEMGSFHDGKVEDEE